MSVQADGGNVQPLVPRYRKVFVVSPANIVTGGPEALHQLVDAIHRNGGEAYISYHPLGAPAEIPRDYRRYEVLQAIPEDASGNLVVLPEILPLVARMFSRAAIAIWWLSVDHYLARAERPEWDELRRHLNFAQSRHAAEFLRQHGVGTAPLTDYVNDDFLAPLGWTRRRNAIAHNVKSTQEVERLRRASPELAGLTWIEMAHLPREQVRKLLSEVKIYADLGHHPGRDRMPREAALCGACVLTNRRGSAGHTEDVPLPPAYKLDQEHPDYAQNLARTIRLIFATRPFHGWRQQGYRRFAADGKAAFFDEVRRAFFQ